MRRPGMARLGMDWARHVWACLRVIGYVYVLGVFEWVLRVFVAWVCFRARGVCVWQG